MQQLLASHDAVFVGRVVAIREDALPPQPPQAAVLGYEVTFNATRGWKGVHESRVIVINPISDFGATIGPGHEYLVFAKRHPPDSRLVVSGCGMTLPVEKAAQQIHDLGTPEFVYPAVPANDGVHPTACAVRSGATATGEFGARRG